MMSLSIFDKLLQYLEHPMPQSLPEELKDQLSWDGLYKVQKRQGQTGLYPSEAKEGALSLMGHMIARGNYPAVQWLLEWRPESVHEPIDAQGHSVLWQLSGLKHPQVKPLVALCLHHGAQYKDTDQWVLWRLCALSPQSDVLLYKWFSVRPEERFWECMQKDNITYHPIYQAVKTPWLLGQLLEWGMSDTQKPIQEQMRALLNAQKALMQGLKEFGFQLPEESIEAVLDWCGRQVKQFNSRQCIDWIQPLLDYASNESCIFNANQVQIFLTQCQKQHPQVLTNVWGKRVYNALESDRIDRALIEQGKMLLNAGMDPMGCFEAGSDHQRLPLLHISALLGNESILKMWMDAGAKVEVEDQYGRTVFQMLKHISESEKSEALQQWLYSYVPQIECTTLEQTAVRSPKIGRM